MLSGNVKIEQNGIFYIGWELSQPKIEMGAVQWRMPTAMDIEKRWYE